MSYKELIKKALPRPVFQFLNAHRKQFKACKNLAFGYRQYRGLLTDTCLNADGDICPWYCYPALDYLARVDMSSARVLEYGSGYSTLYYAKYAQSVVAVEHNKEWSEKFQDALPDEATIHLVEEGKYASYIQTFDTPFDVIVIDGIRREDCAKAVSAHIKKHGGKMIIFDNADWFEDVVSELSCELGWIRIPMRGFGPLNDYATQTDILMNPKEPLPLLRAKAPPVGQKPLST